MEYDVEVQYTFVRKIKIAGDLSLQQIQELVQSQGIPDDIELW